MGEYIQIKKKTYLGFVYFLCVILIFQVIYELSKVLTLDIYSDHLRYFILISISVTTPWGMAIGDYLGIKYTKFLKKILGVK